MKKVLSIALVFTIMSLVTVIHSQAAMTIEQVKTAWVNEDTVYYAPESIYNYLAWEVATLVGAPFNNETRIPGGKILWIRNVPTIVDSQIVDNWTVYVDRKGELSPNRLFSTRGSLKTALINSLMAKVAQASAIAAMDEVYADSVLDIGGSVVEVAPLELDFGSSTTELTIELSNTGDARLNWSAVVLPENMASKIDVDPDSGQIMNGADPVTVTVTVDRTGITPGEYEPSIRFTGDNEAVTVELAVIVP